MKKLFIFLITFVVAIDSSAQESNKSLKIDSLQYQLDKLQHDYDFLDCSFQLYQHISDLEIFNSNIKININEIANKYLQNRYNIELYRLDMNYYEQLVESLRLKEVSANFTIAFVLQKIESSTFSKIEIDKLKNTIDKVKLPLSTAKESLNSYKEVLDIYKNWIEKIQSQ
ncbi:MAG: hypothetical protein IJD84_00335 [Parabacteroides sp.]|nr:hypothetical protein [Parabacteroides sp.]